MHKITTSRAKTLKPNQPAFTSSKLAIKTLEQGVSMFKVNTFF